MPKFTSTDGLGYPDLRQVALPHGTPERIPLAMVSEVNGVSSYETLFSFEDAEGRPLAAAYPGTYGPYLGIQAGRGAR